MAAIEQQTRNFDIQVEDPKQNKDGEAEARIVTKPLGDEGRGYDEKIKIKGRTVSEYANNIKELYDLSEEEKAALKTDILSLKNEIRDKAAIHVDNNGQDNQDAETNEKEEVMQILHQVMAAGGNLEIEALLTDYDAVRPLIDKYDDYAFIVEDSIQITDEGREEVKDYLGFEAFEGDPEAEAQQQLENDPLKYYLDSFNKIHKGDHLLKIWELISALSAKCADRQIHSWAVGPSGKGKSHLKRRLLDYLPSDAYERKESFSPKALQYKSTQEGPGFLNNQLVYFDEVGGDDIENAIELMRLLTDQDQDTIVHETVKDQEILTIVMECDNITVWFTSVETVDDEQLKNRFILTNPDASSAQDETVNQHQQNILNYGGDLDFIPKEATVVQRMVRDLREQTPEYKPVVPFKINWKQEFNRRLYPFFYTLMGMIAKIHYKNRVMRDGYILVTRSDFELARVIWESLIDTTVAQTDEQSIRLLKQLPENETDAVSRQDLRLRLSGFSTNKVAETCDKLEETEELQLINTKYEDGMYKHWAGEDVKKLVDNEPEIREFNEEIVTSMIEETGVEPDEELITNIFEAEIPVIDFLKEKIAEQKRRKAGEDEEDNLPDISDEEEKFLQQCHQFAWEADVNSLEDMSDAEFDFWDVADSLEEKDVIRIDGENMPSGTAKLEEMKANGEVIL